MMLQLQRGEQRQVRGEHEPGRLVLSGDLNHAVANAVGEGVIIVVAAGNDNADACGYSPAGESSAVTVGSTTDQDTASDLSSWGSCVDVYARGTGITADSGGAARALS